MTACNSNKCEVVERYKNNNPKIIMCGYNEMQKPYLMYFYSEDNVLEQQYTLINDELNGEAIEFYHTGEIKFKRIYKDNVLDGISTEYYLTGEIKSTSIYVDGLLNGDCFDFSKDGKTANYNYFFNDKPIFVLGSDNSLGYIPIIEFYRDTLIGDNPVLEFDISIPLPDSLFKQNLIFAYGVKPLTLKDSIILHPSNKIVLNNRKTQNCSLKLNGGKTQLFYGYVFDEDEKTIYQPFEKVITVLEATDK